MKKAGLLIFFSALLLSLPYNVAMGLSTQDYPYYKCPSMERYSPLMNVTTYCKYSSNMKPSDYTRCTKEFKEKYSKAKIEYRNRECKLNNVRYAQYTNRLGTCKLDYKLKPSPTILLPKNEQNNDACTNHLKSLLKKAYPDINEQVDE